MNTPKQNQKSNYTSPIKNLKNTNGSSHNQYQQEFYRIKTQRLQTQVQQLKLDNSSLKNKLIDLNNINQVLRQRIIVLQTTTRSEPVSFGFQSRKSPVQQSKYKSDVFIDKSTYTTTNAQIQRLSKQLRVLKNDHQIQMSKLRDQNKKLNRKLSQNQTQKQIQNIPNIKAKLQFDDQKQNQDKLGQFQRQNTKLRQNYDQRLIELKDYRLRLKQLEQQNQKLIKQNQENSVLKSSQARSAQNLKIAQQHIQNLQEKVVTLTLQNKHIQEKQKQQKQQNQQQRIISQQQQPLQIKKYKKKIIQLQQKIQQKNQQISQMLIKLRPLLKKDRRQLHQSRKQDKTGDSKRASLSMLQVFLTKYKINVF